MPTSAEVGHPRAMNSCCRWMAARDGDPWRLVEGGAIDIPGRDRLQIVRLVYVNPYPHANHDDTFMPAANDKHHTKKDELIAVITTLRTANAQASSALDSALANIEPASSSGQRASSARSPQAARSQPSS